MSFGARAPILAGFIVLLAVATGVSMVVLRELLTARVDVQADRALGQEVEELRRLARGRDPRSGRPFAGDARAIFDTFLARNVLARDETVHTLLDGRFYRSSAPGGPDPAIARALQAAASAAATVHGTVETADGPVRYVAAPVGREGLPRGTFAVTHALRRRRDEADEAVRIAGLVSLAVLLLAPAVAWIVAGRVLAPLSELRDTARSIGDHDLTRRIAVRGSDEIAELARAVNAMLDRLERAFAAQRALVSDVGHELRTPITIIRGHLELLGDDPSGRRETVALVTDELDRMARVVDDLLTLARAERSDFLARGDVDVDVLTEELAAKARALAPDRVWTVERIAVGRLRADRQRLTQAVINLARNAVEHTGPGDRIVLGSALADGEARIWVRDSGPGIARADRERIFERFVRGDRARRHDGAGLGLAIVRAIVEAHDGRVELESRPGAGATFTIVVPIERGEGARWPAS